MPNKKTTREKLLQSFKGKGMGGSSPKPAPRALPVETKKKAPRALPVETKKKAPKAEKVGGQTLSDEEIEKYHKNRDETERRWFEEAQKKKKEALKFYKSLQT
tara:strand:- start:6160 stop:6468 length:309 start_codon:yes stop_codon:yes gene_type:complete